MQTKFSKSLLLASTSFSLLLAQSAQAGLYPLSFTEMYNYAAAGNLTVLNNAVLRGLDINSVNDNGDTGLCVAIRRNNHIAYETFKKAGASTRPHCLDNISKQQQKRFAEDHKPYEVVYEDDDNSLWWWIGGAAVAGGVAIAAGSGGGGGSGSDVITPTPEDPTVHSDKGLGYIIGTTEPSEPETTPYQAVAVSAENDITQVNREALQVTNNANMWVYNPETFNYDTVPLADLINFDKDINLYTRYIAIGMRAYNKSAVINDSEQTISLTNNSVAMDALLNSSASNLGTIEMSAQNGSIAMVAGDYSSAGNGGTISMEFSGKNTSDSVIGMYADTNSSVTNNGTITGKTDSAFGKITGMQLRLTNYYADFNNQAANNGNIELTGSANDSGALSLWGMSSWLDDAFINGTQSIENLDKASLTNNGNINLTFTLQSAGEDAEPVTNPITLANGNGGIVGMHADTNTTAVNNGNITLTLTGDSGQTLGAGMQSVRGGTITNETGKNITVTSEGSAYGMMAVNGNNSGDNFSNIRSTVTNNGNISVTAKDTAYGIYSATAGDINNSGTITITDSGTGYGIYSQNGNVNSTGGNISITGTGEKGSYGIYAQAEADSGFKINNAANINMSFAPDEEESGDDEEEQPNLPSNYGIFGWRTDIINSGDINITQLNTKVDDIYGIASEDSSIENSGNITLNGSGSGIYANGGSLTNSGTITLNDDGYGLIAEAGDLTNSGTINLNGYGYGIFLAGGNMTNDGEIVVNGSGWAIGGENANITNNSGGKITIMTDNSAATFGIDLTGKDVVLKNNASIFISSTQNSITQTIKAINSTNAYVENSGDITIGSSSVLFNDAYGIYVTGANMSNSGNISIYGSGYGIFGQNVIDNKGNISIFSENDTAPVYGIFGQNGAMITNEGQINISSSLATNAAEVYGIYGDNAEVTNSNDIKIGDNGNLFNSATGIQTVEDDIINSGTVRIYGSGKALSAQNGSINNKVGGDITMIVNGAADSYGIYLNGEKADTINNQAAIKMNKTADYQDGKKIALIYSQNGNVTNSGSLELGAKDAVINNGIGIQTDNADVNNQGTIVIYGNGNAILTNGGSITNNASVGVYGNGSVLNVTNGNVTNNANGNISINTDGKASAYGIYSTSTGSNTINNQASISVGQLDGYSQAQSTANYAIWTDNANIINSGSISLGSSGASLSDIYGLYASENGNIENSGVITLYGAGTGIYTENGSVNNTSSSGIIYIYSNGSTNSYGIAAGNANNNQITNQNKITISATDGTASSQENIGILANNVNNSGTIEIGSTNQTIDNAVGIKGKIITNNGEIKLYGNNVNGIVSEQNETNITNQGKITLQNCTSGTCHGIWVNNAESDNEVNNSGEISVTADNGAYGILNAQGYVNNSATISINAEASYGISAKNIDNSGSINLLQAESYALATDGGSITNHGIITSQGNNNDGLYGTNGSTFKNYSTINLLGDSSFGIHSTQNTSTYNEGAINVNGNNSYGINVTGGTVENIGNITTAESGSYAIYVNNVTNLNNSGTLTVDGESSYGIYADGSSQVTNSGTINVNAQNSFGIYALGNADVTNSGNIYLNATSADALTSALYAGGNAKITNSGNLYIKGSGNSNIYAAYTENSGQIVNEGTIYVQNESDKTRVIFGNVDNENGSIEVASGTLSLDGEVLFGANSHFSADEIDGLATVSANAVKQNNLTEIVLSNNFSGNTDNLEVKSQSYLFDSHFDGQNTTLTMKEFSEVEQNASLSEFLQENYAADNNQDLFDALKSATSQSELTSALNQQTGRDFIPALAEQNLALMKDLNRQIDNSWFAADQNDKFVAALNYYNREFKAHDNLSGSDVNAVSLYGLFRNTDNQNLSYGLGWSLTKADTKFDNDVSKDEVIAQILLPYGFNQNYFDFFGNIYGGYGYGDYTRYADGKRYKGDIKNYYYGINNELRGKIKTVSDISIQPTAELNVNGLYQRGISDGKLNINHNNNISVESGLGLYAEKKFAIDENNSVRLRAGGTWYHEFNDNYQNVKIGIDGMDGTFALGKLSTDKDRALLSINGEYKNNNFSLYGESALDIANEENWIFNIGVKYSF